MDDVRRWLSPRYNYEEQTHHQRSLLPHFRAVHPPLV